MWEVRLQRRVAAITCHGTCLAKQISYVPAHIEAEVFDVSALKAATAVSQVGPVDYSYPCVLVKCVRTE